MSNEYENFEKEYDDQVYEDEYYEENYDEEELVDDDDMFDDDGMASDEGGKNSKKVNLSFACEDCDYRWDDVITKMKGNLEDEGEGEFLDAVCPMCGSVNVEQI